jgi:mRNA interferase YafQ
MRKIEYTNRFRRDFRRERKNPLHRNIEERLDVVLELLELDKPLPPSLVDHPLIGNYIGFRGCHLKPDLILIYQKVDTDILRLIRLGSHSNVY